MTVDEFVRCRKTARLLQIDLVPIVGKSRETVSRYECGATHIPCGVANIMRVLASDPDQMVAAFRIAAGLDPITGDVV